MASVRTNQIKKGATMMDNARDLAIELLNTMKNVKTNGSQEPTESLIGTDFWHYSIWQIMIMLPQLILVGL